MPRSRRGQVTVPTHLCEFCKRPYPRCVREPCPPRVHQFCLQGRFAMYYLPPYTSLEGNYPPSFNPPFPVGINQNPYASQSFIQTPTFDIDFDLIYQTSTHLLEKLHDRSALVGKVHMAVMQTCTPEGIIVDLVIYDSSGEGKITGESEDNVMYVEIVSNPSHWRTEFQRFVVQGVLIPWSNLPINIKSLPVNARIQSTLHFIPPMSVFRVYCEMFDPSSHYISLKMAKQAAPVIQLQTHINKELSFSKQIQKLPSRNLGGRPRFLIIMDFEATCDFAPQPVINTDNSEIIEFPWIVLDTLTLNIVHQQRIYVKPSLMDGITNYCKGLTGITKEDCSTGIPLADAIHQFDQFIHDHLFPYGHNSFRIVTDSVWDLQVQLRLESQRKGIDLAWWFNEYFDLRQEFRHVYAWFPFLKRGPPLHVMLRAFNLDFIGRHHSGLDDCMTIAQVVKILLQLHPSTFTQPKVIPKDYNPHKDPSWCSFMGVCPPDAWQCLNDECLVWNKPSSHACRFCNTERTDIDTNT